MLLTKDDCIKWKGETVFDWDYSGMVMILDVKCMKEQYRDSKYQIVTCGGFGCSPTASTNSTFVCWLIDKDTCKYSRNEIIGCPKREVLKQWFEEYKDQLCEDSKEIIQRELSLSDQDIIDRQEEMYKNRNGK